MTSSSTHCSSGTSPTGAPLGAASLKAERPRHRGDALAIVRFETFPNYVENCVARLAPSGLSNIYALMTAMASRTTRSTHSCCTKGRSSSSKHVVTLTRANRGLPSVRALT